MADTLATQLQMNKQLKLINDFYYLRPGEGALSSNTCFSFVFLGVVTVLLQFVCFSITRVYILITLVFCSIIMMKSIQLSRNMYSHVDIHRRQFTAFIAIYYILYIYYIYMFDVRVCFSHCSR